MIVSGNVDVMMYGCMLMYGCGGRGSPPFRGDHQCLEVYSHHISVVNQRIFPVP